MRAGDIEWVTHLVLYTTQFAAVSAPTFVPTPRLSILNAYGAAAAAAHDDDDDDVVDLTNVVLVCCQVLL